jgi:lysophospholipase L1-like esterase
VTLGSALIVATCSTGRTPVPAVPPPPDPPADTAPAKESVAPPLPSEAPKAAAPAPPAADPPRAAPPARGPGHEVDHFFEALRGLEKRARREHVRVAWLGDSHGASDLWSGPLRTALQTRFGDGGPGFVHVGYKSYRHEAIRLENKGKWAVRPKGPSTAVRTGDGVFGLGGILLAGFSEGPRAALTVTDTALPPALTWDLCYKLGSTRDEFQLRLSGVPDRIVKAAAGEALGALRHLVLQSAGASPTLHAVPLGGSPELCGVTIEADPKTQPGVVLDTLGINGARLTTPLAWNEPAWIAELARRAPSLVILEYGTNEASDHTITSAPYVENLRKLMARVHGAAPDCDCLVLGPTDRADTLERTPLVRDALRDAARASGCMFWDTYAEMGGKASILAWRADTPPRAAPDGVHLNARGYRELGEKLAAHLLTGYVP